MALPYVPTTWASGDLVSSTRLNKLENGVKENSDAILENTADVNQLKSEIDDLHSTEPIHLAFRVGYFTTSHSYTNSENYLTASYPVVKGDSFNITGHGGNAPRLWIFFNASFVAQSYAGESAVADNTEITAPSDGYLYFQPNKNYDYSISKIVVTAESKADKNTKILNDISVLGENLCDESKATAGYYMTKDGAVLQSSAGTLSYSPVIPVESGKTYYFTYKNGTRTEARYVTACDANGVCVSASGGEQTTSWTCPSGIEYVVVSFFNDAGGFMMSEGQARTYSPYGNYIDFDAIDESEFAAAVESVVASVSKTNYLRGTAATLSDEGMIQLAPNSVKTRKTLAFTANITTFSKINIGHGKGSYAANYAEINDTNIVAKNADGTNIGVYPHGLTITNNLQVYITKGTAQKATIRLTSDGHSFEQTNIDWMGDNGRPFVESVGSTLTDCVLSWTSETFDSPVWVCGDSYIGIANTARWPYYLLTDGHTDILFSGYGGAGSSAGYTMLTTILNCGKPKKLIWALGMNDPDSASAVNATWKSTLDSVIAYCSTNNIDLILATIPTAIGNGTSEAPAQNNEFKNAVVRASGYRYIDFATAVGAQADGSWFSGMLSSDNVHPTEYGAKALYMQALADAPELAACR